MRGLFSFILIIIFGASLLLGCNQTVVDRHVIGIDVSKSASLNYSRYHNIIRDKVVSKSAHKMLIYIFSYDAFEGYSGDKPVKDREIEPILNKSLSKKTELENTSGTDFIKMLIFLTKKINSPSHLTLYTDGFFEFSIVEKNVTSTLKELKLKGLESVELYGVDIKNKEKIYQWFDKSGIIVKFHD